MGAYSIGTRHAWRFSHVQAMAGAPSWIQYTGGRPTAVEHALLVRYSAMQLFENTVNTDFHYYHGTEDGGPMRPAFIRQLTRHAESLGVEAHERWYQHGHDLLYIVHRHGRIFPQLAEVQRDRHPSHVRVVSGDYRARRQHWVTITRFDRYPELGAVRADAAEGSIVATTENVRAFSLDLRDAPLGSGGDVRIVVDDEELYNGPRNRLGHVVHIARNAPAAEDERAEQEARDEQNEQDERDEQDAWGMGFLPQVEGLEKRPGLSGPYTDAYHDEIIHVYGTQNARNEAALRRVAQQGANGWPLWVWNLGQRVVADTDVTEEMAASAHLALYGGPGDNAVLARIRDALPIRAEESAIVFDNGERFAGGQLGVRFIYPNPEAPDRYVLVHTGTNAAMVGRTRNLPDFVPDFVVYGRRNTTRRPRLIHPRGNQPVRVGFFDGRWRLPPQEQAARILPAGVTDEQMRRLAVLIGAPEDFIIPDALFQQTPPPQLEPGELPDAPARPRRFLAARDDPNGPIARTIARLVPTFYNYRAMIPGGVWRTSRRAVFKIRNEEACLEALDAAELPYRRVREDLGTPTPSAVRLTGSIGGVRYESIDEEDHPLIVSCELAARIPYLSRILRRQRVRHVTVLSAHRTRPAQSFHRLGMALDLFAFDTPRGNLSVNDDFIESPSHTTCDAPDPDEWRAAALQEIACDLAESNRFNSVLTPNYNDGHRNHFHIDIRPDDNRIFVR